jgi:hypothetical protein
MNYTRTIDPHFETIGKRRKFIGYLAELRDGEILLHSQVYDSYHTAEVALDGIVYDLLSDQFQHGLVDTLPLAV